MDNSDDYWKRYLQMAASGALTGAGFGGIGRILGGSRSIAQILGSGAAGAAIGATAIPASAMIGEAVLGAPEEEDRQPYTLRAGLGGAAAGAGLGGIGGAAMSSGLSDRLAQALPKTAKFMSSNLPLDNIIIDKIRKIGPGKGALAGSLLGALGLGFMASDEGQQIDTIRNLSKEIKGAP